MNNSQILALGVVILVTLAFSGCLVGGSNAQTFDTNWGKLQIKVPQEADLTSVDNAGNSITLMKGTTPVIMIMLSESGQSSDLSSIATLKGLDLSSIAALGVKGNIATSDDNHKISWYLNPMSPAKQYMGSIDYSADKNLLVNFIVTPLYYDAANNKIVTIFEENDVLNILKSLKFIGSSRNSQQSQSTNTNQVGTPSSVPANTKPENIVLGPYTMSFNLGNVGAYSINVKQPEEEVNGTSCAADIEGKGSAPFLIRLGIMEGHKNPRPANIEEVVRNGLDGGELRKGLVSNVGECGKATVVARTIDGKPGTLGSITCSGAAFSMILYPEDYFPENNTMTSMVAIVSAFPGDKGASRDEITSSLINTIHVEKGESSNAPSEISAIPSNGQESGAFHMAVIGDSIAWGNGLNKTNKYPYLLADWLEAQLNRPVDVMVYAHSGAAISGSGESCKTIDQNLNSGCPTLMDQARNIKNKDDVDLILVSGGINDVGIGNILDANTPAETINSLSESIREPMTNLLIYLLEETNAKIIVTGYYPIITEDSTVKIQDRAVAGALALTSKKTISQSENVLISAISDPTAAKVEAAWYLLDGSYNNAINLLTQDAKLRTNSDTFYTGSSDSLKKAVQEADKGQNRIKFIDPLFERKNSYRASNSFLWELNSDLKTNDFQYQERAELVEKTYALDLNPLDLDLIKQAENKINPIAHPNRKGAAKYADAIKAAIQPKGLEWLQNDPKAVSRSDITQEVAEHPATPGPDIDAVGAIGSVSTLPGSSPKHASVKEWAQSVKGSTTDVYNYELGLYYDADGYDEKIPSVGNNIKYLLGDGQPSKIVATDATNYMNGNAI